MLKKIISGAQTGADRAALDFAIEVGIPYGGWIPKGRKAEDEKIPEKYDQLQEMTTSTYPPRTEKNILDSDATLIVCHGKLSGGSLRTQKIAEEHNRPVLHIDLTKANHYMSAAKILNWIAGYRIEILNVAGSRASEDPKIYEDTLKLLKAFYHLATANKIIRNLEGIYPLLPLTIEEALKVLIDRMDLKSRTRIARMPRNDLIHLHPELGSYINNRFELSARNEALLLSCRQAAGIVDLDSDNASLLIIVKLWERLRKTYGLRVIQK